MISMLEWFDFFWFVQMVWLLWISPGRRILRVGRSWSGQFERAQFYPRCWNVQRENVGCGGLLPGGEDQGRVL